MGGELLITTPGRNKLLLKHVLCIAVLVLMCGATALRADVFSFSYAGAGVSASGTLTADNLGSGVYAVTGMTGTRNGKAITDSLGGIFYYGSGNPFFDKGGIAFTLGDYFGIDTVLYDGGQYLETMFGFPGSSTTLNTFTVTPSNLPEPSTLLLLLAMGSGFWVLGRKLPTKNKR
jgi:hypothetical protein